MARSLNLDDIQGNVIRAYGRYSFPCARFFFLHISDAKAGRKFVDEVRGKVTTATRWSRDTKPKVTLNIGFTFPGLHQLALPTRTLKGFPDEFIDGMKARASILGDSDNTKISTDDQSWCRHWDPVWQNNRNGRGEDDVHVWISMNAQAEPGTDRPVKDLEAQTEWLRELCQTTLEGKVRILATNGQNGDEEYHAATALFYTLPDGSKIPTPKEHFGFTDGIGDPVFEGQYSDKAMAKAVIGRGKWMDSRKGWQPLATGEFILGHADESQELPPTAMPPEFMHNGTFMVYRKLHENVASFREVIAEEARTYALAMGIPEEEAEPTLMAKMVGRWPDGVPLSKVPTYSAWSAFKEVGGFNDPKTAGAAYRKYLGSSEPSDFRYGDDMAGYKCPATSHLRRTNTRDYLDPMNKPDSDNPDATTRLNKRRRVLRRGLPYGPAALGGGGDGSEQGVTFMAICANIFRQFEFVQQQWIQYGLDFNVGNNTCPLLGNHDHHKRHVIPSDPETNKPPYVMSKLKTFVETRGGDYFFLPSLTAMRMMAMGIVDPT